MDHVTCHHFDGTVHIQQIQFVLPKLTSTEAETHSCAASVSSSLTIVIMKGVRHPGISRHTFKAEVKFIITAILHNGTLTAKCNKIKLRRNQEQSPVTKMSHYHNATGRNINDTSMLLFLFLNLNPQPPI